MRERERERERERKRKRERETETETETERKEWGKRERNGGRERDMGLLFHSFKHPLVDSCACPVGRCSNQLSCLARVRVSFSFPGCRVLYWVWVFMCVRGEMEGGREGGRERVNEWIRWEKKNLRRIWVPQKGWALWLWGGGTLHSQ